jgi:hypothetical protein
MLDVTDLELAIKNKDVKKIVMYIKEYNLKISNSKITASKEIIDKAEEYWDKRQLVKKINLNSLN